mmetsp:Transcript_37387/g.91076  ORF Transcript_37387/g.91076 Transcript_37387/m.91076 type:complete len:702 (+) Transcript_37387:254-2359(+)
MPPLSSTRLTLCLLFHTCYTHADTSAPCAVISANRAVHSELARIATDPATDHGAAERPSSARAMTAAHYAAIQAQPFPAVAMLSPPDCATCAALKCYWKAVSERTPRAWSVNCTEQQAICIDRLVGAFERRGTRFAGMRAGLLPSHGMLFSKPDAQPSFQAWTGREWLIYKGQADLKLLTRFVALALTSHGASEERRAEVEQAAQGIVPAAEDPRAPRRDGGMPPVQAQGTPRWGQGVVRSLTSATRSALMGEDFSLLLVYPRDCQIPGQGRGSCSSYDQLWGYVERVLASSNGSAPVACWHVACDEQPDMCTGTLQPHLTTESLLPQAPPPVLFAWNGSVFERYLEALPVPEGTKVDTGKLNEWVNHLIQAAAVVRGRLRPSPTTDVYPLGWAEPREEVEPLLQDAWWGRVEARAQALGGQALDADGFAYELPGFLTAYEVAQLVKLGRGHRHQMYGNVPYLSVDYAGVMRSDVLRRIDERIANLTGVSSHPDGGDQFMLQARWPHDYDTNNQLHHDMNREPRRVATVIMYLTGGDSFGAGHTLFPCLRRRDVVAHSVTPQGEAAAGDWINPSSSRLDLSPNSDPVCRELVRGFEEGKRDLPSAASGRISWSPSAHQAGFDMCQNGSGVRMVPSRGAALLFASSATPDASKPLPWMWHRGCHVESGAKLFVTKFVTRRETPSTAYARHTKIWRSEGKLSE